MLLIDIILYLLILFFFNIGMLGLTAAAGFYNIAIHEHPHRNPITYTYNSIRAKPFPWPECPDCPIFDGDCWAACRGETTGGH